MHTSVSPLSYAIDFGTYKVDAGVEADYLRMPQAVLPVQTHSCNVAVISSDGAIPDLDNTDAIICLCPDIRIGVRTADCVPVLVYTPDIGAIGAIAAIHAGWRGSLGGIVTNVMQRLSGLGADLSKASAAFGPSICGTCYEISAEMAEAFHNEGFADCLLPHRHLDLEAVNIRRLVAAGISAHKIRHKRCCTYENPKLPSWRRTPCERRLLTWISMLP